MTSEIVLGAPTDVDAKPNDNTERGSADAHRAGIRPPSERAEAKRPSVQVADIGCTKNLTFGLPPIAAAARLRESYTKNLTFHSPIPSSFCTPDTEKCLQCTRACVVFDAEHKRSPGKHPRFLRSD